MIAGMATMNQRSQRNRPRKNNISLAGFLACVLIWQVVAITFGNQFIPSFMDILSEWWRLLYTELPSSALYSLSNVAIGVFTSSIVMVAVSFLFYVYPVLEDLSSYVVDALRSISPLALYPLFIITMGLGKDAHIAVIIWATWSGVLISTTKAIKQVDYQVIEAAKLDGADKFSLVWYIILPLALPYVLSALRVAIGWGWLSIIASEMIGSSRGLGFMIINYASAFQYSRMYATIFTISLLSLAMNTVFMALSKYLEKE